MSQTLSTLAVAAASAPQVGECAFPPIFCSLLSSPTFSAEQLYMTLVSRSCLVVPLLLVVLKLSPSSLLSLQLSLIIPFYLDLSRFHIPENT